MTSSLKSTFFPGAKDKDEREGTTERPLEEANRLGQARKARAAEVGRGSPSRPTPGRGEPRPKPGRGWSPRPAAASPPPVMPPPLTRNYPPHDFLTCRDLLPTET
ncbi:UNVERIFIED_CONTAM: hypothetical protein Sradi_7289200 [Sesamum radiatum]|uniref:Uncharacterized protein n=1 Tax=Sesamum radiatum TaxID=300843 RepID=A0AAW2II52_SESRA